MSKKKTKRKRPAIRKKTGGKFPSVENQFKPGQSGNPDGRPKKRLMDEIYEEVLQEHGSLAAAKIVRAIITRAINGDVRAAQLANERTQGKPKQAHEITGKDGGPIQIVSFIQRPPQNAGT